MHAADISTQTRPFALAKEWTELLYQEFFTQGDLEKHQSLPVSFLCDRETTQISQSQPGFLNFLLIPLFKTITEVMPGVVAFVKNAEQNSEEWKKFDEGSEFKKIYT